MEKQSRDESRQSVHQQLRLAMLRTAGLALRGLPATKPRGLAGQRPRVVVLRPDHLGDVLLSRRALALLYAALPEGALTVAVGPWGAPSLQGLSVDTIRFSFPGFTRRTKDHALAPYLDLLAFSGLLRRGHYDAALVLRPDHWWGALACALARVPIRVGRARPETAPFLTHALDSGFLQLVGDAALEDAQALLDALGQPLPSEWRSSAFDPTAEACARADAWLASQRVGSSRALVAIHPGSGASIKLWPDQRWVQVGEALTGHGATIVLTAGADELVLARRIQQRMSPPPTLASDLSWDELAALYQRVNLVVGMDSGPLHLAQAVGTPTVRLYGPSDPRLHGPAAGTATAHIVLPAAGGLACVPCGDFVTPPCGHAIDPPCLAAISVEQVVAACLEPLARNSLPSGRGRLGGGNTRSPRGGGLGRGAALKAEGPDVARPLA